MQREIREEIEKLLGESKAGVGKAIRLCRENGISPAEFGSLVASGLETQEVREETEKGNWHFVVTSVYGRTVDLETKREYDKRQQAKKREERKAAAEARNKGSKYKRRPIVRGLDD